MWDAVNGGFAASTIMTPQHRRLSHTQFFLNIHPNLHNVFKA
jgi:hypothetical protein